MRQLKHHEQKLLKKVDFLNVSDNASGHWLLAGPGESGAARTAGVEAKAFIRRRSKSCQSDD